MRLTLQPPRRRGGGGVAEDVVRTRAAGARLLAPGWRPRRLARALLSAGLLAPAGAGLAAEPRVLVTVGEVTDRRAVFWAGLPGPGPVAVEVVPSGGRPPLALRAEATAGFTVKVELRELAPATSYAYRVRWGAQEAQGAFTTAPEPTRIVPTRLHWSGDLGGAGHCRSPGRGYPIFRSMAERRPALFLFVGDTIYADHRCPVPDNVPGADFTARDLAGFRAKHRYNRADPAVQAYFRRVPVFAIWDDHEVRNDFAGSSEPLAVEGLRAFLEAWPILPPEEDPTRLYRSVRWGRLLEVFILDTRQYRSPNDRPDGPGKTMLGEAQRAWLVARVGASSATWKLVVSSVPLAIPTGRRARDGWANGSRPGDPGSLTGFERELLSILDALRRRGVRNLVWLVADAHRAEILRHEPRPGFGFYELVAGPLRASRGRPGWLDDTLRPRRLWADGGFDNFGELDLDPRGLTVRILDETGRVRFETRLRAD